MYDNISSYILSGMSNASAIDEETKTWKAGLSLSQKYAALSYAFPSGAVHNLLQRGYDVCTINADVSFMANQQGLDIIYKAPIDDISVLIDSSGIITQQGAIWFRYWNRLDRISLTEEISKVAADYNAILSLQETFNRTVSQWNSIWPELIGQFYVKIDESRENVVSTCSSIIDEIGRRLPNDGNAITNTEMLETSQLLNDTSNEILRFSKELSALLEYFNTTFANIMKVCNVSGLNIGEAVDKAATTTTALMESLNEISMLSLPITTVNVRADSETRAATISSIAQLTGSAMEVTGAVLDTQR